MTPRKVLLWSLLLVAPLFAGCLDPGVDVAGSVEDPDGTGNEDPDADPREGNGTNGPDDRDPGADPGDPDGNDTTEPGDPGDNETNDDNETQDDPAPDGPYGKIGGDDLPDGAIGDHFTLRLSPMRWSETTLTVLIVPALHHPTGDGPTGIHNSRFLRAVEDSITHWKEAIDQYGSPELRGNISFDVYVAGRDDLSPSDIGPVDIYITNLPGGAVVQGLAAYPLSPRCVIANFGVPSTAYKTVFMVSVHEFGHCLGMSHPGEEVADAEDHDPWFDVMSYSYINRPAGVPDVRLDCVSNLNLLVLHESFAEAFGRTAKDQVTVAKEDYFLTDCAERFLGT